MKPSQDSSDPVGETVQAVTDVHRQHRDAASPLQTAISGATKQLGRPISALALAIIVGGWIAYNLMASKPFDPPPFAALELFATLSALFLSALILVTQRRDDLLANRREELTLELALLNERKTAKLIALVEELRRDMPDVADRDDAESRRMAEPSDAKAIIAASEEARPDDA